MPERIATLERLVADLTRQLQTLKANTTIPFDTEKAFRSRLGIDSLSSITASSTPADAQDQAVNEAGAASYTVLDDPDLFLQVTVGGTTYDIPAYTQ